MRSRRNTIAAFVLGGAALLAAAVLATAAVARSSAGGVFRVAGVPDAIDPAITLDAYDALQATCAKLMNYPDKPMPAGTRVIPEVAASYPVVSRDGKTYTFTIRKGFRFSTGEPVTAESFAHEIDRLLNPVTNSPWVQYVQDIVGAEAVMKGTATQPSGVIVQGSKLIVRLTHAARDFPARTAFTAFCAVPADLPVSSGGVGAPLPGAGPYTITTFVPGQELVLQRNPYYRGSRPHHVKEIVYTSAPDAIGAVESGAADFDEDTLPEDFTALGAKYRPQLHVVPGIGLRFVILNSSRRLFRNNVRLRRAVNFAIDRSALIQALGGRSLGSPTDQYLPSSMPGFVRARIYPLVHPNLTKARSLAHGHAHGGKATLYIKDAPADIQQAQILQRDLKAIGIKVTVKMFPGPVYFQMLFTPKAQWDIALLGYGPDYFDPYAMLNVLFDGRLIGTPYGFNLSHFDSQEFNKLLDAASRLTGAARYRAYGKLDVELARDAAPAAAYLNEGVANLVSRRAGCLVFNPDLDLAAVCLK